MVDVTMSDTVLRGADELVAHGDARGAIELLSEANRAAANADVELALVRIRRQAAVVPPSAEPSPRGQIVADGSDGGLFEIAAKDLTVATFRAGLAQSGCVLVRGLVRPASVDRLVAGIDATLAAYDAAAAGSASVDAGWYSPGSMPDRGA